jgi:hypothetical protein
MTAHLVWGKVPDYLPAFAIFAAAYTFLRNRKKDREEAHDQWLRQQSTAAVAYARTMLFGPTGDDVRILVYNDSQLPVFQIRLSISHPQLQSLTRTWDTINGGNFEDTVWIPHGFKWKHPPQTDEFTWELFFTDAMGQKWLRRSSGELHPL